MVEPIIAPAPAPVPVETKPEIKVVKVGPSDSKQDMEEIEDDSS